MSWVFAVVSVLFLLVVFFKQKTAYEMRISDWSSDVCSSDLGAFMPVGENVSDIVEVQDTIGAEQTFCTGVSLNLFLGQLGHYISLLSIDIAIALSSCLLQFLR